MTELNEMSILTEFQIAKIFSVPQGNLKVEVWQLCNAGYSVIYWLQ